MQQTFLNELLSYFLGDMTPAYLIATMIFILIGSLIHIRIDVLGRSEESPNTPYTFDWRFFWRDNRLRIFLNLIVAYCAVRFFSDIFPGMKINMFWAWSIGLIFDFILVAFREVKYVLENKLRKAMKKLTQN